VFKREVTADGAHRWVGLPDDRADSSDDGSAGDGSAAR